MEFTKTVEKVQQGEKPFKPFQGTLSGFFMEGKMRKLRWY